MFPLISLQAWTLVWQKSPPIQSIGLLSLLLIFLLCLWTCWPSFLSCWSIGFFIFFLGLSRPIYFTFTSCCAHGFVGCHFYHVCPLSFLALFLGFHGPFTLLLPLVVPMDPLVVIPAMLAHWAFYLFFWASMTHLLYLYILLCLWARWLSFLPCWPIGFFISFLGLPRPIYFALTSSTPFLFNLSSLLGLFCR